MKRFPVYKKPKRFKLGAQHPRRNVFRVPQEFCNYRVRITVKCNFLRKLARACMLSCLHTVCVSTWSLLRLQRSMSRSASLDIFIKCDTTRRCFRSHFRFILFFSYLNFSVVVLLLRFFPFFLFQAVECHWSSSCQRFHEGFGSTSQRFKGAVNTSFGDQSRKSVES